MASDALSALKMQVFENKALDSVCISQQEEEVDSIDLKLFDQVCNLGQGLDWISHLPDELLIDIVSRLTFKEAFRTSVLSTRWIDFWKSAVSVLDFEASEEFEALRKMKYDNFYRKLAKKRRSYMDWVNGVVSQMQQSCSRLTKFRVAFSLSNECNSEGDIDRWLMFAISKRVESLHLTIHLLVKSDYENYYVFSEELYNHIKTPAGMLDIGCLRSLHLSRVNVRCEVLEHFIANCPLLEELVVKWSEHLEKLKVVGSSHAPLSLKHLEVRTSRHMESVEINHTPHLERLIYEGYIREIEAGNEGYIHEREIQVGNCPSLVDLTFGNGCFRVETFRALSGCASQLVSLRLLVNVPFRPLYDVAEHSKLERLTVEVNTADTMSILGLIPLINVCPRLDTLQLFFHTFYSSVRPDRPPRRAGVEKERRDSIKVVEVVGFRGYDMQYEFMEYVMEYFVGLEKIVIDWATTSFINGKTIYRCSKKQLREAEKRALELKSRASPTIEFLVI